jgi:peptidoglycan/xylan/chitin deacetylase (PgdA/CDA1 family)
MSFVGNFLDRNIISVISKVGPLFHPVFLKYRNEGQQLLIYYFHGLYESESQKKLNHADPQNNLTLAQFQNFIEYFLNCNYHFISPDDLVHSDRNDKPLIMLTFDDGYFNNSLALPTLDKYKVPATFFITTRNVTENRAYWWDIIYKYRSKQGVSKEMISQEQAALKSYKFEYIDSYIHKHFGAGSTFPWSEVDRPLTPSELKVMATHPLVSIGNHTHNHSILTNYTIEEVEKEIVTCNSNLKDIIGHEPDMIAFPNGNYNENVVNIALRLGFRLAFTTNNDINPTHIPDTGLVKLNRFMAQTTNIKSYAEYNRLNYMPSKLYYARKHEILKRGKHAMVTQ